MPCVPTGQPGSHGGRKTMMHKTVQHPRFSALGFITLILPGILIYSPENVAAPAKLQLPYQLGTLHGDRMVIVGKRDRLTWIYQDRRLRAYDRAGKRVVDQLHVTLPKGERAIAMLAQGNALWLAVGKQLVKFDSDGQVLTQRFFYKDIHSLSYDLKRSQLLVATPRQVFVLDLNGREVERIHVSLPYIA